MRAICFDGLSSSTVNKMKSVKWQKVTEAINSISSELRTLEMSKRKYKKSNGVT